MTRYQYARHPVPTARELELLNDRGKFGYRYAFTHEGYWYFEHAREVSPEELMWEAEERIAKVKSMMKPLPSAEGGTSRD